MILKTHLIHPLMKQISVLNLQNKVKLNLLNDFGINCNQFYLSHTLDKQSNYIDHNSLCKI